MRQSIWERDVEFPSFPKLEGDIKTDVLVIGGGLCGVLCAWFLKQAGVDYVLVEGDAVGREMCIRDRIRGMSDICRYSGHSLLPSQPLYTQ